MFLVVPNELSDKINAKIDAFIEKYPDMEQYRAKMFDDMLTIFNERGVIPDLKHPKKA